MVYVSESHLSRLLLQLVGFSYVMDGGWFHITNKTFLGTMHSIYVYLIQVLKKWYCLVRVSALIEYSTCTNQ